jgi:PST family polysaccharide transporter
VLKKIKINSEIKLIAVNFFSLGSIQVFNYLIPIITLPYLIRVLGIENYGLVAFATSLVLYFQSVTDYGFTLTATREIAVNREDPLKIAKTFYVVIISQIILSVLCLAVLLLVLAFTDLGKYWLLYLFAFLSVPANVFFPNWFFQGMEKMKFMALFNLISKILYTVSIFILIKKQSDYYLVPLLNSVSFFIIAIASFIYVRRNFDLKIPVIKLTDIKSAFKDGFHVFINQLLPNLYNNGSIFILGLLVNNTAVGVLSASTKFIDLCILPINLISRVFFPSVNRDIKLHNKFKKIILSLGLALFILMFFLAPSLNFFLLKTSHPEATGIIRILSVGIFGMAVYLCYGTNYLLVLKKDKQLSLITTIICISSLIISVPLILTFKTVGAALNLTIARVAMGLGAYLLLYRYLRSNSTNPENQDSVIDN